MVKSLSANDTKVSFVLALKETIPEAFVVPVNCLLTVYCVSVTPPFVTVRSVLITFFGNLNNALFFSVSLSLAIPFASRPIASLPNSDSSSTSLPASAPFASVPSKRIEPSSPAATSNTKSAVKSCPESASSIKTDLAPENV